MKGFVLKPYSFLYLQMYRGEFPINELLVITFSFLANVNDIELLEIRLYCCGYKAPGLWITLYTWLAIQMNTATINWLFNHLKKYDGEHVCLVCYCYFSPLVILVSKGPFLKMD